MLYYSDRQPEDQSLVPMRLVELLRLECNTLNYSQPPKHENTLAKLDLMLDFALLHCQRLFVLSAHCGMQPVSASSLSFDCASFDPQMFFIFLE